MNSKKKLEIERQSKELHLRLHELARSTEPADRQLMESNVLRLYKALSKRKPHILWCDSPLQLFVIPCLIDRFARSGKVSFEEMRAQAEKEYWIERNNV